MTPTIITYTTEAVNQLNLLPDSGEAVIWNRAGERRLVPAHVIRDARRLHPEGHIEIRWDDCRPIRVDSTVKVL